MIKHLAASAVLVAALAVSAFSPQQNNSGLPTGPAQHPVAVDAPDALDTLAASMTAGTWQKLHDSTSQTRGIGSIVLPKTRENWLITSPDWTDDWDNAGTFWVRHERGNITTWSGGVLVDKVGHTRFYIPAAGGHFGGLDNGVYSFDLLDAAHAINTGSRQGTEQHWVKAKEGARIVWVNDSDGNPQRPFNAKNPYDENHQDYSVISQGQMRWVVYDRDDPFGDDQCNVGPPDTHLYGGTAYIPEYDGILVHGFSRGGSNSAGPRGFWLFDIASQDWQLLPPDRDLTPPYDCSGATAGNIYIEKLHPTSWVYMGIVPYAEDRIWIGNRNWSARWRMDDVDWTVSPEAYPNGHAQQTGLKVSHPTKPTGDHVPLVYRPVGGTYNGNLGAWIFFEDENVGSGNTGYAVIWPNIAQDDVTNANMEYMDYLNYVPNNGTEFVADLTAGLYSATHDKFFFIHKPWLPDFNGQVYAAEVVDDGGTDKIQWSTYIDPSADPGRPTQSLGGGENGTYNRFSYIEDRNLFLLVYDEGVETTGYVGQVYLLKGI